MSLFNPRKPGTSVPKGQMALWLALGGLFATFIGTFGALLGLALLTSGLVLGIQARREARRQATVAPGATPAIVIGAVSLFFGLIGLVGFIIFRTEIMTFEECSLGANTEVAKQACMDELVSSLQERIRR
jgi:uncharacterized membrane protein YhaH (DUF805 family)